MDQPVADWLTKDFFTHCLQHEKGKETAVVSNFKIVPTAIPPGTNYTSKIDRAKVEYKYNNDDKEVHTVSLIVKSELAKSAFQDLFEVVEPKFYYEFLPYSITLLKENFTPKTYFTSRPSAIVLEDLKEGGFEMADKMKQLDFEHCRLYMEAAAALHASSFAVHKEHPELIESMGREKAFGNDLPTTRAYKAVLKCGLLQLASVVKGIDKFKKYSETIAEASNTLWDMLVKARTTGKSLKTITQGDPWTNNMMFKYGEDGVVRKVKLIDFQLLKYGSPANDLSYFIWTSANQDVRRNSLEELYHIYLDRFNNNLQEFGCSERLSYDTLMEDMVTLMPFVLHLAVSRLPVFCNPEPFEAAVFFEEEVTGKPFERLYNENYRSSYLPRLLEDLELIGAFKYLESLKRKSN